MANDPTKDPIKEAQDLAKAEADARKAEREAANAAEATALNTLQQEELAGIQKYNTQQYENQGQILNDIYDKINVAKAKDETAQKRENAYRYISGVGDTLSSLANLVGTAHGAANQQQTYNSHAVVQKAEEARKARKLEMDDLAKRQDEMKARLLEMKAAGTLKEAEVKARQAREKFDLASKQRATETTASQYDSAQVRQAGIDAQNKMHQDRTYQQSVDQAKQTQENWQKTYTQTLKQFEYNKDKDNYPIFLQDGSRLDIPKNSFNDISVGELFALLPTDKQKEVKGKPFTKKYTNSYGDEVEETDYEAPSLERKLAAVVAYAKDPSSDPTRSQQIKDKMVAMATAKPFKEKDANGKLNVPNW